MHWSSSPELRTPFTDAERDRRWARIRELMGEAGVDVLVSLPQWMVVDSLYLANESGVVIFPLEGDPALIIGGEGSDQAAKRTGWIGDRASVTEFGSTRVPYGEAAAKRLASMGLAGKKVAICGLRGSHIVEVRQPEGYANYTSIKAIVDALPGTEIVDGTAVIGPARHQKSEEELDVMRRAVKLGEASAAALKAHARPGVAQAEAYGHMILAQLIGGANETMASWCGGKWGADKWRFTSPPPGIIEDEWHITCEIGPSVQGYNCQVQQPLLVGDPPAQALEIFELNLKAFDLLRNEMRAGNTWGNLLGELRSVVKDNDYDITFLIHGRGLGNEGPMIIPVDAVHQRFKDWDLKAGSTFILKPYVFPKGDPHVTRRTSVTWGDTVVVREDGAERLGTREPELYVV